MSSIDNLLAVMARLREPDKGCAWDLQQTFESIAPYTIEEAYEVADAIARGNMPDLRDELGDLLLQVVFHARMAEEAGHFVFDDVAAGIADKMIRRHPHVFADDSIESTDELNKRWEDQKAEERRQKKSSDSVVSALDDVALGLPALTRAEKLQKRAKRVGFDWDDLPPVEAKVREELLELMQAHQDGNADQIEDELGDLLFSVVNLARHLNTDPETALRKASRKFEKRFRLVEALAAEQQINMEDAELELLDKLWDKAKVIVSKQ